MTLKSSTLDDFKDHLAILATAKLLVQFFRGELREAQD